jgi:hypothetical protein
VDILFLDGDLAIPSKWVIDKDRTQQAADILFKTFLGEFLLDPSVGLWVVDTNKNKRIFSRELLEQLIKNTVASTDLFSLVSFTHTQENGLLSLEIELKVKGTQDLLILDTTVPLNKVNFSGHHIASRWRA